MALTLRIASQRNVVKFFCSLTRPTVSRTLSTSWIRLHDYPTDRKYTASHEWLKSENGSFTVGVTSYAQEQLGDLVFVELPEIGDSIDSGIKVFRAEPILHVFYFLLIQEPDKREGYPPLVDVLASLESVKTVGEINTPGDCTVKEVNNELEEQANLINKDPYNKGWIAKVDGDIDYDSLMSADDYNNTITGDE